MTTQTEYTINYVKIQSLFSNFDGTIDKTMELIELISKTFYISFELAFICHKKTLEFIEFTDAKYSTCLYFAMNIYINTKKLK